MTSVRREIQLPPEQQAIRDKCFHPSGTFVEFPLEDIDTSIPARFEKIARLYPERLAVISGERSISYQALNGAANHIAAVIAPLLGSGEEPLALLFGSGVDVIAAILGVLKLGKIYVPLDPSFPLQRNRDVLDDAAPRLIITNQLNHSLAAELAGGNGSIVNIDRLEHVSSGVVASLPQISAEARAYILYTSGSTGKPKGVVQNHRNVLHLVMRYTNRARITPADRVALLRSFNVHGGTYLTLAALMNGATLLPFDVRANGLQELAAWLAREEITICRMGPTLLRHFAEALRDDDRFPKLREISFSGEPLRKSDIEICRRYFPQDCVLVNSFGSTEVSSCCEYIIDESSLRDDLLPCGYAASGMEISLIKDNGESARPGEIGEIAVQSCFLALGYHRDDERTTAKFLPSLMVPQERIYLTGDLGRFLPDGRLMHVGRNDSMVKIRGYRVELAEIEAALLRVENIKEAVVVGQEDSAGESQLVAYIVVRARPAPTVTAIKRALHECLPDYSLPAVFVELETIPLTPNGKVDRRALPSPSFARPLLNDPFTPPQSSLELLLAEIWEEVLGVTEIGLDDNFFDLGGHSLAAMRVASRVIRKLQLDLPVSMLFDAPTIAELANVIAAEQSKRPGTLQLERRLTESRSDTQAIPRSIDRASAPLSFAQQRLWFLEQLEPNSPRYNVSRALRLRGTLNVEALEKSLNTIVRRHDVLRSKFHEVENIPVQTVVDSAGVSITFLDLSDRVGAALESDLLSFIDEQVGRPYNLTCDAPLRIGLIRLTPQDHVLLITLPHIVTDAWSMIVFCRELVMLYDAFAHDRPWPLTDLPIQYADYAVWQREWLQAGVLKQELAYWRSAIDGIAELSLPTDRQRPASLSWRSGKQTQTYATALSERLAQLARAERTTLFTILLTAFKTLLFRYTAQGDVAIGCPVANRLYPECEGLIGFFVNTLIVRSDLSGDPTFRELLVRVREVTLKAYEHQQIPFERLVQELKPDRDLSRNPLVQVSFQLRNYPKEFGQLDDLIIEPFELTTGIAKFDLSWAISNDQDGLKVEIEYSPDLFDAATIERMFGHFHCLLEGIVRNPDRRISDLPLLTEAEKRQLLHQWNDTAVEYPNDKCIHELFEAQVHCSADAIALVYEDQQLTYGELNRRANQVAHYLRKHGVGPESLVGICMERSIDMITALLGILKAGAAYVPLDPEYPSARLRFILEDTQAAVILTQEKVLSALADAANHDRVDATTQNPKPVLSGDEASKIENTQVVCLDRDWLAIGKESAENLDSEPAAGALACVIYTSGSTGTPKGVAVTHRGVNRLLLNTDYLQITPAHTVAQAANAAFDAATFEIWGALLNGARLAVIGKDTLLSPESFSSAIERLGITTLFLTTALFNSLAQQIPSTLGALEHLLFGGEAVDAERVRALLQTAPPKRLLHLYGPTEATTLASWYLVETVAPDATSVPIGKPIANTAIYILDANLKPVPIGIAGEMYIGGPGLARGYLNRPELTAEDFIEHSFDGEPAQRLYRTGDLARYRPDGNIEFRGRLDDQVKIRGYRIEPGEIGVVLRAHPAVRECVVIAYERPINDSDNPKPVLSVAEASKIQNPKFLIAYLVPHKDAPATSELRAFLKIKLPDYMVPSAFIVLNELPVTSNGKIDRKALPAPDYSSLERETRYVAPRDAIEEIVASIWSDVLGLQQIGAHDNFFEVGGHSLLATQIVSRARAVFQKEVPVRWLFDSPTIAGFAALLGEKQCEDQGAEQCLLHPVSRQSQLPLSFAQQRLWFLDQLSPGKSVYSIPAAFRLRGPVNIVALERSLNEVVRRHEILRTTFSSSEGEPVQIIAPSLQVALETCDIGTRREEVNGEAVRVLIQETARQPFDLRRGPLFRAALLQLGPEEHILILTLHHIVSDGWSMGVLYSELATLYEAFCRNEASPLPDLKIQYADYAVWQRKWLTGDELDRQVGYWKAKLEGAPGVLSLPLDRPRSAAQSRRGARETLELSAEVTDALKGLGRREGATLFMTLLAALQIILHRYTGQDDIVVGAPVANRNRAEVEGLIGFFVNTLALRGDTSGNPTFTELLAQVRETALGAYAHQDLPFEKLVEVLQPQRSLRHSPLFQVMLNVVNIDIPQMDLAGITIEPFVFSEPEAKFDLTLYARERGSRIRLDLVYNAEIFGPASMGCFLQQYGWLLEQIVTAPQQPIQSYSLVTSGTRQMLPDPAAPLDEPPQQLVTDLVRSWAERARHRCAITQGERRWSYGELVERGDGLARVLQATGLARGDVVAVHGARSFGVIAAMLGVFSSGGVLVLVDRDLPRQRKLLMLRESKAQRFIFVGKENPDDRALAAEIVGDVLRVDSESGRCVGGETSAEHVTLPELLSDDPAYIFFTSGTSGVPKGVLGVHKGLSHFISWQRERFGVTPDDRVAQLTALSFDPVLRDVFLALTSGATLCLPQTDDLIDSLPRWLQRERISILHIVPSLARWALADRQEQLSLPCLRLLFFMGEPLPDELVHKWRALLSNRAEIVNLYGPTETTLVKCFYCVPKAMKVGVQPIGLPLPQSQALVLGEHNRLCGVNEVGEIVLRTPYRTLGYINASGDNRMTFVANPFRDDPKDLLYRTGDLGRYAADATLEILGRIDDQVKIRGVRAEPAEIAARLGRHPALQSCYVLARRGKKGEPSLVAYVVLAKDMTATTAQLRSDLAQHLPAALLPAAFVFMAALPLTPNGKVDRQALAEPDLDAPEFGQTYVAPRNALEESLAAIWSEVLGIKQIGVHDNFFNIGGHSLKATQVVARMRAAFQSAIPLRHVFEHPTILELAAALASPKEKSVDEQTLRVISEIEAMSEAEAQKSVRDKLNVGEVPS